MQTLTLSEYEPQSVNVPLDKGQLRTLAEAHIVVAPSTTEGETYTLTPSSYIGALSVGDLAVLVRPKVPIDRVMFLVAYALDPQDWRKYPFGLQPEADVLEAIIPAFVHHTRQAIKRGLLRSYKREEDALPTVRGRIRFDDQINRRYGIPLPLEVVYDEFTEDIEENRLLKAALYRLVHMRVRSPQAQRDVRALRPAFNEVSLGAYRKGRLPIVQYTRLNQHYRPAVELARLIIENCSLELIHGKVVGASFLLNMNQVFEKFMFTALQEALGLSESEWRKDRLTLDEADNINLEPDLCWRRDQRWLFVGDAKYKRLTPTGFPNADIYQMLAYCTAANLPSGLLVYAKGEAASTRHRVKYANKTIEIASLDLQGQPEAILAEVGSLAKRVRMHAMSGLAVSPVGSRP